MSYKAKSLIISGTKYKTHEISEAIESFNRQWQLFHSSDTDIQLFHYTTLKGLQGILDERMIWSSHTNSFNDPTELQYGKNLIVDELTARLNEIVIPEIQQMLKQIIYEVNIFIREYQNYVTCFCESGSLLSQWRSYAESGGGFSIGFVFTSETTYYHQIDELNESSYLALRKVVYEKEKQMQWVKTYVDKLLKAAEEALFRLNTTSGEVPIAWAEKAATQAINVFIELVISFKNPAFYQEAEWRIIKIKQASHKPGLLHFRQEKSELIPYLHTYICTSKSSHKFPINKIIVGPLSEPKQTKASIKLYVHKAAKLENKIAIDADSIFIDDARFRIR